MSEKNKKFCIYAWASIEALPDGTLIPCCDYRDENAQESLRETDLIEFLDSKSMVEVRKKMLAGQSVRGCAYCYKMESVMTQSSPREKANAMYRDLSTEVLKEGVLTPFPRRLVLRNSNVCNLACRTCNAFCSTGWFSDAEALDNKSRIRVRLDLEDLNGRYSSQVYDLLKKIDSLFLIGGEPLLIEAYEHYIDRIIELNRSDLRVTLITNFSLDFRKYLNLVNKWNTLNQFSLWISVDGVREGCEYLRHGLKWQVFEQNLEFILSKLFGHKIIFYVTVSILNVYHVLEIVEYLITKGYVERIGIEVNLVSNPSYLCIQALPVDVKTRVAEKYSNFFHKFSGDKFNNIRQEFDKILGFMNGGQFNHDRIVFNLMTKTLDKMRKQSFKETFSDIAADLNFK